MLQTIRTPGGTRIEEIGKKRGERFIPLPYRFGIVRVRGALRKIGVAHFDSVPFKEVGDVFFRYIVVNLVQRLIVHDAYIAKLIDLESTLTGINRILRTVRTKRIDFRANTVNPTHLPSPFPIRRSCRSTRKSVRLTPQREHLLWLRETLLPSAIQPRL